MLHVELIVYVFFMLCVKIKQVKKPGLVTTGIEADDNGHLVYSDGQILQNRCQYSFSSVLFVNNSHRLSGTITCTTHQFLKVFNVMCALKYQEIYDVLTYETGFV